ncbi:MAG TPA: C40 family peptidase [Acidimicrobiales bacterium]|nr:C40 family peptidase [Acidimicrobiales bacterium]
MTLAGEVAVALALSMVGRPYEYGASAVDTSSFDCSSLVQWAWGLAGVALPRASIDQLQALPPSPIDDLQAGDLVFYDNALANGPPYRGVNHVVIWVGDGQVVEASSIGGGVRVIAPAEKGRPLGVRRPGVAGEVPPWQYEVRRAIGLAGGLVLERSGRVVGGAGIEGRAAAIVATPSGLGYWVASADGRVVPFGDATACGDAPAPVVAMAATPTGPGYWTVDSGGRVSAFGDAGHHGDGRGPAMAMAATPSGLGYWVAHATGCVSAHGDARQYGGRAGATVPVVAMAATPSGLGYWLADAAGEVSAFGDAEPVGGCRTEEPVVAMAVSDDGCRLLDAGGRIYACEPARVTP